MLIAEPAPTRFDLKFRFAGFPVRVHPFFWLVGLLFSVSGPSTWLGFVVWMAVAFVSILVHELGHALAFRRYGVRSHLVLYGLGGLACPEPGQAAPNRTQSMFVSFAGPLAGFVLAAVVLLLVIGAGYSTWFMGFTVGWGPALPTRVAQLAAADLLYINVFWGLINLLPVFPLDGGQIFRDYASKKSPEHGLRMSLRVSVWTGAIVAVLGLVLLRSIFLAVLFGYLAYVSFDMLRRYGARFSPKGDELERRARTWWRRTKVDLESRKEIYEQDRADKKTDAKAEADDLLARLNAEIKADRERAKRDEDQE